MISDYIRFVPLRERNIAGMIISAVVLGMCLLLMVILWPLAIEAAEMYWWVATGVTTLVTLMAVLALVTGEMAWLMIGLLLHSRQR